MKEPFGISRVRRLHQQHSPTPWPPCKRTWMQVASTPTQSTRVATRFRSSTASCAKPTTVVIRHP